jgi:hypothetical protein
LITADRASKIQERCLTFFAKLRKFRALQLIYMPGAERVIAAEDATQNTDAPLVNAENVKLWLPSDLPEADRERGCLHGIADMEARLREAQASDALKILRSRLHTKRHMIGFRDSNITGQVKATKARTLIDQVGEWVTDIADKYRRARKALTSLKGSNFAPQFKTLKAEHLTLAGETDDHDKDARKRLKVAGTGKNTRIPHHLSGGSKAVVSWIWTAEGVPEKEEESHLHSCEWYYCI